MRIGRDPGCELCLTGDRTVSRVHAVIARTEDGLQLQDLGSSNGTRLDGQRIEFSYRLSPGDRVGIGRFVIAIPGETVESDIATLQADEAADRHLQAATGLSARELDVLRLVCAARSDQEVADELCLSVSTVRSHLDRIRDKTGCRRRAELIQYAHQHGVA